MNIAIILSGGIGSRMGMNIPKQYIKVDGKPIIWYCLKIFIENTHIDALIIGREEYWGEYIEKLVDSLETTKPIYYSASGETRQYSIFNALLEAQRHGICQNDVVIIHDAARPLVSNRLIDDCIEASETADAVLPILPVKDTLYQSVDGEHVTSLLNRNELFAGQAPEAFRFGKYINIHREMSRGDLLKINGSAEIAFIGGLDVKLIKGDMMNFKITTPEDLSNFESIIKKQNQK